LKNVSAIFCLAR